MNFVKSKIITFKKKYLEDQYQRQREMAQNIQLNLNNMNQIIENKIKIKLNLRIYKI